MSSPLVVMTEPLLTEPLVDLRSSFGNVTHLDPICDYLTGDDDPTVIDMAPMDFQDSRVAVPRLSVPGFLDDGGLESRRFRFSETPVPVDRDRWSAPVLDGRSRVPWPTEPVPDPRPWLVVLRIKVARLLRRLASYLEL